MPKIKRKPSRYRTVSVKEGIIQRVEEYVSKNKSYHSIAEFTAETLRLRLNALEKNVSRAIGEDP
jgi:lysyl-tRNA synthetase class I